MATGTIKHITFDYETSTGTVARIAANSRTDFIAVNPPVKSGYKALLGIPYCWNGVITVITYSAFDFDNGAVRFALQNEASYQVDEITWSVRWLYVKE